MRTRLPMSTFLLLLAAAPLMGCASDDASESPMATTGGGAALATGDAEVGSGAAPATGSSPTRDAASGSETTGGAGGLPAPGCAEPASRAYSGTPAVLPGLIEAEDFDVGANGVAYHDATSGNVDGAYRDTDVDIKSIAGGHAVGYMQAGEWLEYTAQLAAAGEYQLVVRAATTEANRTLTLSECGEALTNPLGVPTVGSWGSFGNAASGTFFLGAGLHTVRITVGALDWVDLDSLTLVPAGSSGTGDAPGTGGAPATGGTPGTGGTSGEDTGYDPTKVTTVCPVIPTTGIVTVSPGQDVGALASSYPEHTKFVLEAGTYAGVSITPKNGQEFYGRSGAHLRGDGATYAFYGNSSDVYICGVEVSGYNNPLQQGALNAQAGDAWDDPGKLSHGWLIENVDVHDNAGGGIMVGAESLCRNSRIHHNGVIGIKGSGAYDATFDNVEVDNNGIDNPFGWPHEGGGSKFAYTHRLTVRNSHVHHNVGPGLWTDIDNYDTLYEDNLVEDNQAMAIFHEISMSAVIRNNIVLNNGQNDCDDWPLRCAGVYISSSTAQDGAWIEVYDNYLEGNRSGLVCTSDGRRGVGRVKFWNNEVVNSGATGADGGGSLIRPDLGSIYYSSNSYSGNASWIWEGGKNWSEWQALGHDLDGSSQP